MIRDGDSEGKQGESQIYSRHSLTHMM